MTAINHEPRTDKNNERTDNKKLGLSRRMKLIAGIAAGSAVIGVGSACSAEEKPILNPNYPSVSGEAIPGADTEGQGVDYSKIDVNTLTVDEFYDDAKYPQEERVKWANEIIKQRQDVAYAEINTYLTEHGWPTMGPLVEPAVGNTGDEILVQHTVAEYIASTAPTPDEGRKLMAAVIDESVSTFDEAMEDIADEKTIGYNRVKQAADTSEAIESPVFTTLTLGDYRAEGVPSKVMNIGNVITEERNQIIVRFVGGRYITVSTIPSGDSNWIKNPRLLSDK